MTKIINKNNYQNLLKNIQNLMQKLQENISKQKVEFAWNVGKLIEEDLLKNQTTSYKEGLFTKISADAKIDLSTLYKMHTFFKSYPTLPKHSEINWSHYKILAAIKDDETRENLENLTKENSLTVNQLKQHVKNEKLAQRLQQPKAIPRLEFQRGKLFNYTVKEISGEKFLDLGFHIFKSFESNFADGDIVESIKSPLGEFSLVKSNTKKAQIHTYKAHLERVVDGDTIRVYLDLGFGILHREILRLAQINAPEKDTKEGEKATAKLQEILKDVKELIIKTNKTDIFGRYIADVFLTDEEGQYLSQMLLDAGVVEVF